MWTENTRKVYNHTTVDGKMAQGIPFLKMHALGNDFVILDARTQPLTGLGQLAMRLADRRLGIGCDQVIILENSLRGDVFMRILNPDGSEARACGNSTRCVSDMMMKEKGTDGVKVETVAGVLPAMRTGSGVITVDMGKPRLNWDEIPLSHNVDTLCLPLEGKGVSSPVAVNMGNPHAVFFVPDINSVPLEELGPRFERDVIFPDRANIEFVEVISRSVLRMRVWERGAGVTFACGSAACATVVAGVRRGLAERKVIVKMDGGDLSLEWREEDGHVYMTGPFTYVFRGEFFL